MHCRQQNFNINRKMVLYSKLLCFVKRPAFKTAGLYTFSHFLTKGISFFLLFIYTNPAYISVDENGLISLMNSAVLLLSPFLALGTIQSASADYFRMQRNEFKDFFTTGFFAPILVMLLGMATMFVFKGRLSAAYGFPVAFIFVVPLMAFFSFCNELYVVIMRNSDDPVRYFKVAMWRILLEVGLSLLLVVVFALRWKGRVAGIMATNVFILTGAYFYLLQHIFSPKHQLLIKYDWYDPNCKVKGMEIGAAGSNFTAANIRYSTLGFGYINYMTENIKLVLYYARVWNEKTQLTGYTTDVKDNVFTCRLQFRF